MPVRSEFRALVSYSRVLDRAYGIDETLEVLRSDPRTHYKLLIARQPQIHLTALVIRLSAIECKGRYLV